MKLTVQLVHGGVAKGDAPPAHLANWLAGAALGGRVHGVARCGGAAAVQRRRGQRQARLQQQGHQPAPLHHGVAGRLGGSDLIHGLPAQRGHGARVEAVREVAVPETEAVARAPREHGEEVAAGASQAVVLGQGAAAGEAGRGAVGQGQHVVPAAGDLPDDDACGAKRAQQRRGVHLQRQARGRPPEARSRDCQTRHRCG